MAVVRSKRLYLFKYKNRASKKESYKPFSDTRKIGYNKDYKIIAEIGERASNCSYSLLTDAL